MGQRIQIICGHYGCGKTNLSINLAIAHRKKTLAPTVLVDLDLVNPYFRSSEYAAHLTAQGIRLIAPGFAGTTLDSPSISPELYSVLGSSQETVFLDTGGDDAGIIALGGFRRQIEEAGYRMMYVVNRYRVRSQTPEEAAVLLDEIQRASGLEVTGIVNNSHLGKETDWETIRRAMPFGEETAALCGKPLLYHTFPAVLEETEGIPDFVRNGGTALKSVRRYVTFPWEQEEQR